MKRKILAILMALALALALLPSGALAADAPPAGELYTAGSGSDSSESEISDTGGGNDSSAPSAEIEPVESWGELVNAIKGEATSITLGGNLTRGENDEAIVINRELTIDLLGWTLNGGGEGSVIKVVEGGDLTIEDSSEKGEGKITGGKDANGGGIHVDGGALTMEGGAISGNNVIEGDKPSSNVNGGGVYVSGGTFNMSGGEISGNMARNGGGVYLTDGSIMTMTGGKISQNTLACRSAEGHGGGVYVSSNCIFTVNSADKDAPAEISGNYGVEYGGYEQYQGGGICVNGSGSQLNLNGALVSNNRAVITSGKSGGGIYATNGAALTITDSEITNNSAFLGEAQYSYDTGGGGICLDRRCTLTMTGTTVSGNTAKLGGGLCLWDCGDVTITSCKITENMAMGTQGYNPMIGGGVFYNSSSATLTITGTEEAPTEISQNKATLGGGGLCNLGGTVKIENTDITGNESQQGGGVHSQGTTELTNCTLSENKAQQGGGICSQGTATLTNCTLSGNDGSGAGGALSVDSGTTNLNNCTLEKNTSSGEKGWGGGAYVAGTLIVNETTISDNSANDDGVGAGIYNSGTVTFNSGTISGNTAAIGGGVANFGSFTMSGGVITDNEVDGSKDDETGIGGGVANAGTFTMNGTAEIYGNEANMAANDFYNGDAKDDGSGFNVVVDGAWDQNHDMELDSLAARQVVSGTFTLRPAKSFGYSGWFDDELEDRYYPDKTNAEYTVAEDDNTLQYLTLGEKLEQADVTISILDMTAYTGGDSLSDTSFPEIRYKFTASDETVDVEKINFKISLYGNEKEYSLAHNIELGIVKEVGENTGIYVIPTADYGALFSLIVQITDENGDKATNDLKAGEYTIDLTTLAKNLLNNDSITAEYEGRKITNIKFEPGTLTVRNVSDPEEVLDETDPKDIATEIVTTEDAVNTGSGMAVAVIPTDATFYTNGREELGLLGENDTPKISLMFDDLIPREDIITGGGTNTTKLLVDYAATKGYTLTDGQYQFKYLDLINENDGNAWVSTDKDITIFWPYPAGVAENHGDYEFSLLHFTGLHREYDVETEDALNALISASTIVPIDVRTDDNGVWFTLPGNLTNGSFSPFALVWEAEADEPDEPDDEPDVPNPPPVVDDDDDEPDDVVPPMLNGDDHFAYVIGYDDGTVKPNGQITRAEVATIIFRLLDPEVRDANLTTANSFTDVSEGAWYNTAVSTLVKLGIISGRSDTIFDPNAPITRAEFATLFARFDESGVEPESTFSDVYTHWARESIERAAALGWINGYEDGTFRPDNRITRAEAMTMINRVLNRDPVENEDLLPDMRTWTDNQPGTWYYFAVQEATNSHEYTRPDAHEDWTEMTADPDWTRYQ